MSVDDFMFNDGADLMNAEQKYKQPVLSLPPLFVTNAETFSPDNDKKRMEQHVTNSTSRFKYGPLFMECLEMERDGPNVLSFECYSFEPETETYPHHQLHRIRPMKLLYHLNDHTMSLIEAHVPNSGILQDRIFIRQRVPKADRNYSRNYLHWSDLNVAKDVDLFSRTYRITACDHHTRDFLAKNGIEVNEEEEIPMDRWTQNQQQQLPFSKNKESKDKKLQVSHKSQNGLETLQKVDYSNAPAKLHLLACWLDNGSVRTFHMIVHTIDDTVALVESTRGWKGQLFLKRNKLPCITKDGRRFYRSNEMRPGEWIEVYTRPMFIYSCEGPETRNFLQCFGPIDFKDYEKTVMDGPPPEIVENIPSQMKFIALMVGGKGPFECMKFLMTYHVDKQELDITEAEKGRKWQPGRAFLEGIDSSGFGMDQYRIGAVLRVGRWKFRLLEADDATQQYLRTKEIQQI